MKTKLSFSHVALAAFALGTASMTATFADGTCAPSGTGSSSCSGSCSAPAAHPMDLTADEKTQLKAAYDKAMAADPSLQTQKDTLKSEGKTDASKDDWKAFHAKLEAAMLTADPTIGPLLAKAKAAHKGWHHHDDSSASSS